MKAILGLGLAATAVILAGTGYFAAQKIYEASLRKRRRFCDCCGEYDFASEFCEDCDVCNDCCDCFEAMAAQGIFCREPIRRKHGDCEDASSKANCVLTKCRAFPCRCMNPECENDGRVEEDCEHYPCPCAESQAARAAAEDGMPI